MNILILGSGAREHALAQACAQSPHLGALFVAPGNPGCAKHARIVDLDLADHSQIAEFSQAQSIDLVIVGPEQPLVAGIADDLGDLGIDCLGPSRAAAQLEGSKGYAKDFCHEFGIPTPEFRRFSNRDEAKAYVRALGAPIVVKADGLAAGKGVIVAETVSEAESAVDFVLTAFGAAKPELVIEEFLKGEEVSFFALCDGENVVPFSSAQDHKRLGDGDTGPNTGGMGAYSPPFIMTDELRERVMNEIIRPTMKGMARRGAPYRGFLFAGLIVDETGPKVIEFNVRLGDPEAEVILARLSEDLVLLLRAWVKGNLRDPPSFDSETALTVVMAARGYPGEPVRGALIKGLGIAEEVEGVTVLQAGTRAVDGGIVSDGGRVLAVTARGHSIREAQERAYAGVDRIDWPEGFCRRDIGWRAARLERTLGPR
jgi:phosphoribosylamine---glycine ligase